MERYKLENICELITDGTHQTPEYSDDGYIFLSSKDVTSHKIDWNNVKRIPENLHQQLYSRLAPQKGDILLAKNGTTGVAAVVDRDEIFDIYVSLALLRPKKNVLSEYLLFAVNSPQAKRQFDAGLKGIGVPNLHLSVIRKTEIPVPDIDKQKYICNVFREVVAIMEMKKKQLKKMDELIKSRFVELFGDTYLNENKYHEEKLEVIADIVSGITKGRKTSEKELIDVPYMAVSNVKDGYIDWTTVKTIAATKAEIEMYRLQPDDILMTEGGDPDKVGRGAVIKNPPENCIHQNHIFRVRLDETKVLPEYFEYYLQEARSKRYFFGCAKQTTGIASINMTQLRSMPVLLPTIEEQKDFIDFAAQVDKSKSAIQKSLEETQLLFDSLMQKYFG